MESASHHQSNYHSAQLSLQTRRRKYSLATFIWVQWKDLTFLIWFKDLHKFLSCIPHYFYLIYYYFNLFNIIFTRLQSIPIVPVILIFSLFHVWAFLIPTFTHMIYVTWLVSSLLSSQFPDQIILSLSSLSWLIQPEGWVLLWGCEHINKLCN